MNTLILADAMLFLSTLSLRRATPDERHASSQQEFLSTLSLRRATVDTLILADAMLFLSTLSLRRATRSRPWRAGPIGISIHALLAESDRSGHPHTRRRGAISIHALLAESDTLMNNIIFMPREFLSTLSLRRATARSKRANRNIAFLSTLSLRRATISGLRHKCASFYFYPRSPCGERQRANRLADAPPHISIHALLAESDSMMPSMGVILTSFLSTLSLRRATQRT